jgi:hypothetical protein
MNKTTDFITATQTWLQTIIIEHNICPFAKREFDYQAIRFALHDESDIEKLLMALIDECQLLTANDNIETTLLIYANAFADFDDYLDFLALAEDLLIEQDYEGVYQLASFHPQYCFDGVASDDASNYTNRSPYPMLHLLRESSIERALKNYPNPERIPARNIDYTRQLGLHTMQALLANCYQSKP